MYDFGPIKFLVDSIMLPFLTSTHDHLFHNYGLSIVALTIVIKIAFFPLMNKQYKSMAKMQEVAPELTKVREKYKKDPQRLQKEMLGLYKKHGVNPLSGCLPMLIQIPFFFAIYATILSDKFTALLGAPGVSKGFLWLSDLAAPDTTFILPILLAVFTYYSQKLMIVDPKQKMFVILSPIMILFFGLKLPSGVIVYWAVSTIITTIQQYWHKNVGGSVSKVEVIQAKN